MIKSYERQHLAVFAAGYINAAGTTRINFGCQMTHVTTGHYALILDDSDNLIDDESFTLVTVKNTLPRFATVLDATPGIKRIFVRDEAATLTDSDIEVGLFRSVTH